HTIGLYHEQSHPERDKYIRINWHNIIAEQKFNFMTEPAANAQSLTPYDPNSIMHYQSTAFSIGLNYCRKYPNNSQYLACLNKYPTIEGINGTVIGVNSTISLRDFEGAIALRKFTDLYFLHPSNLTIDQHELTK